MGPVRAVADLASIFTILPVCSGSGADHLGLQSATAPALAVLDRVYATQAVLDDLWREHGDDVEGWPPEVLDSLRRRNKQIMLQVMCATTTQHARGGLQALAPNAGADACHLIISSAWFSLQPASLHVALPVQKSSGQPGPCTGPFLSRRSRPSFC